MKITHPRSDQIPQLSQLWKDVFGDTDAFLDRFFDLAYAGERCLCALEGGIVTGMLYWLPCGDYAYLYAVATHPDHRGKGICRRLMAAAHEAIAAQGYVGVLLYPQEEGLRHMYRKMGYRAETRIRELRCSAGGSAVELTRIGTDEYLALRRELLPPGSVLQERPFPELMEPLDCYKGDGLLLLAQERGDVLFGAELLGDPALAPGILRRLGKEKGTFRCPGEDLPFAMFCPLRETAVPRYFAFPLD